MLAPCPQPSRSATLLVAGLLLASLVPIFAVQVPPLYDYPNHLARLHILAVGDRSEVLRQFYEVRWGFLANLGMDLVVPPAARLIGLELAGKLFIALTFVALLSGTFALHYALHDRLSPWPLLAFGLLYSKIFTMGFLNYLFGLGLGFSALAAWIRLWPGRRALRLIVFSALSTLLLVCHMYALGVYGLGVIGCEVWRALKTGHGRAVPLFAHVCTAAGQFAVPGLVFAVFSPTAGGGLDVELPQSYVFKLQGPAWVLDLYNTRLEVFVVAAAAIVLLALVRRGAVRLAPPMVPVLLGGLTVYLAMPDQVFGSAFADRRLPIALAFLTVASCEPAWRQSRQKALFASAVTLLVLTQLALIGAHWRRFAAEYQPYYRAIERLPVGARLLPVVVRHRYTEARRPPVTHLAALAVVEKSAFVPYVFSDPRHQPVVLAPAYERLANETGPRHYQDALYLLDHVGWIVRMGPDSSLNPLRRDLLRRYDFLLISREQDFPFRLPDGYPRVFEEGEVRLYRLR